MTDQVLRISANRISGYWRFALIATVPLAVAILALRQPWADPASLLSDPFDLSQRGPLHPLMGSLSTIGASLFLYAAAVTLFGATLVNDRAWLAFLVSAGLLSSFLAHDDLFGLHEIVAYQSGLHERHFKVAYVVAVMAYLAVSWPVILRSRFVILGASLAFFAASWAFDSPNLLPVMQRVGGLFGLGLAETEASLYAWEDGCKLIGAVLWLWFHVGTTGRLIRTSVAGPLPGG